jgi:hypothetical protein
MEVMKSRTIDYKDWYTLLQAEYISYKLREFLYTRACDKKKFNDICLAKKRKIFDREMAIGSLSIFSEPILAARMVDNVFSEVGVPVFQYSPMAKDDYRFWDKVYSFREGSIVIYEGMNFRVTKNISKAQQLCIDVFGREQEVGYNEVSFPRMAAKEFLLTEIGKGFVF